MTSAIPEILERLERLKELTEDAGCEFPEEILRTAKQISTSLAKSSSNSDLELSVSSCESPDHEVRVSSMLGKLREKNKSMNREVEKKLSKLKQANTSILKNNSMISYSFHDEINSIKGSVAVLELENNRKNKILDRMQKRVRSTIVRSPRNPSEESGLKLYSSIKSDEPNKEHSINSSNFNEQTTVPCSNCVIL